MATNRRRLRRIGVGRAIGRLGYLEMLIRMDGRDGRREEKVAVIVDVRFVSTVFDSTVAVSVHNHRVGAEVMPTAIDLLRRERDGRDTDWGSLASLWHPGRH